MKIPAEWATHKATWTAWPDLPNEWKENQEPARKEFVDFCRAIALTGAHPQETLKIFVKSDEERRRAEIELKGLPVQFFYFEYGDIWLRDTGCLFTVNGKIQGQCFRFNGWGGKYNLARDADLSKEMSARAQAETVRHGFVFEGGSIDHNGNGLWLTTEQCLLNENRNPGMTKSDYESAFAKFGAKKTCWIRAGLDGDHTDGHVDNIFRFVDEQTLICMEPSGDLDPQAEILRDIHEQAKAWASENKLNLVTVKSPGLVTNSDGDPMPASYMNYYIANNAVIVPVYGTRNDEAAVEKLRGFFKDRRVIGLPSNHLLTGGGSFHCITQQEPA